MWVEWYWPSSLGKRFSCFYFCLRLQRRKAGEKEERVIEVSEIKREELGKRAGRQAENKLCKGSSLGVRRVESIEVSEWRSLRRKCRSNFLIIQPRHLQWIHCFLITSFTSFDCTIYLGKGSRISNRNTDTEPKLSLKDQSSSRIEKEMVPFIRCAAPHFINPWDTKECRRSGPIVRLFRGPLLVSRTINLPGFNFGTNEPRHAITTVISCIIQERWLTLAKDRCWIEILYRATTVFSTVSLSNDGKLAHAALNLNALCKIRRGACPIDIIIT